MEIPIHRKIYWPILTVIFSFVLLKQLKHYFKQRNKKKLDYEFRQALDILEESDSENENFEVAKSDLELESNVCLHCIGIVTTLESDYGIIDERFYFEQNLFRPNIRLGDRVQFVVYKIGESEVIKNIEKFTDDFWDSTNKNSNKEKTVVKNRVQILKRNVIGQVSERHDRNIIVDPQNYTVNLNDVESSFVPYVGDWVVLETLTEVDESVVDLTGTILSVSRIAPLRSKPLTGVIRTWNIASNDGVINNDTYFQKDNCERGYVPCVGDKVVAEVIESTQEHCSWRAISVHPLGDCKNAQEKGNSQTKLFDELIENKNGIVIENNLRFESMKLNEKRRLRISAQNTSQRQWHKLLRCSFHSKRSNSQLTLISHRCDDNVVFQPGQIVYFEFECDAKFIGLSRELFVFTFRGFKIGRWFEINVESNVTRSPKTYVQKRQLNLKKKNFDTTDSDIFRGGRLIKPPAFIPIRLGMFNLPNKLLEIVAGTERNFDSILIDLENALPFFKSDLNISNYNDRFQYLLYLEEIQMKINMQSYDMERVRFIVNSEYLMLEIPNLSERRPSLIIGDQVLVSDPWNDKLPRYEGHIHKITGKHIFLKFTDTFHSGYAGQEYNIEFQFGRTTLRRCHQAVGLAVKHLDRDFLFPSGVKEKPMQITVKDDKIKWYNPKLNMQQKQAVINILRGVARPIPYIIFGPPGTGKTITMVEVALQIISLIPGSRLLICSPSNSSADLLAIRLLESKILKPGDLVRLVAHRCVVQGTISEQLIPYCATADIAREGTRHAQEQVYEGIKLGCIMSVLGRHKVTVGTCICLGQLYNMGFPRGHFTHVLVDEAGQATEPEIMIPLSFLDVKTGHAILAGDPLQLGPVVTSKLACHYGLEESFLVRLTQRFPYERDCVGFKDTGGYDPRLITRLVINYRSVPEILQLPNSLFYDSELQPVISQKKGPEADILQKVAKELPRRNTGGPPAVVFHGVRGENLQQDDCPSWYNPHEAIQVYFYLSRFYQLGISADDVGVITPYSKQVKEIRKLLIEKELDMPKISSVEDFQGQERNIIILSTVRSTQSLVSFDVKHALGFITSPKRLNVALTRAQALLIIIGNPHVLAFDPYWRSVLKYCIKNNAYVGCDLPEQYMDLGEF